MASAFSGANPQRCGHYRRGHRARARPGDPALRARWAGAPRRRHTDRVAPLYTGDAEGSGSSPRMPGSDAHRWRQDRRPRSPCRERGPRGSICPLVTADMDRPPGDPCRWALQPRLPWRSGPCASGIKPLIFEYMSFLVRTMHFVTGCRRQREQRGSDGELRPERRRGRVDQRHRGATGLRSQRRRYRDDRQPRRGRAGVERGLSSRIGAGSADRCPAPEETGVNEERQCRPSDKKLRKTLGQEWNRSGGSTRDSHGYGEGKAEVNTSAFFCAILSRRNILQIRGE